MTGIGSAMADDIALGTFELVVSGCGALVSFVLGACVTAVLVNSRDIGSFEANMHCL